MKAAMIAICLLVNVVFAANPDFKLTGLKPIKKSELQLGQLSIELLAAKDSKTIATLSGPLGDCNKCIRGAALSDDLGIRLEGQTLESLKAARKQTSKIKITSCPQNIDLHTNKLSCEFTLDKKPMKLLFSVHGP